MPVTGGIWDPIFYIIIVTAVLAVSIFSLLSYASFFDKGGVLPILEGSVFLTFMTCIPFYVIIIFSLVILSGTIYLMMLLLGATKNGPEATFRTIFYSAGPISFFLLIPFLSAPFIGSVVGGMEVGVLVLWLFDFLVYVVIGPLLYVIGLREVYQTTTGKVIAAVILGHIPMIFATPFISLIIWLIFLGCCGCEPQFCYCPVNRRKSSIRTLLTPLYNYRRKRLRTRLEI